MSKAIQAVREALARQSTIAGACPRSAVPGLRVRLSREVAAPGEWIEIEGIRVGPGEPRNGALAQIYVTKGDGA